MAHIVTYTNPLTGVKVPLRGAVWAFHMSRAQRFESVSEAERALLKAKPFMKAGVFRRAVVEQVDQAETGARAPVAGCRPA